jgi:exopolyphosphatase/guanosine-5'-triphosphate,3'-diphosphate pyrophosphatase
VTGRFGVVDVGTNTVRLLAVSVADDGIDILDEFGEVTRLGGALHATGRIAPEDAERTLACLRTAVARARRAGVTAIDIVGTEVFRRAANGAEVAAHFRDELGHTVRVISGDEEAEASYLGAVGWGQADPEPGPAVVIDVGGGSSEVILGEGAALLVARSLPIGALTLTEEFLAADPPGPEGVRRARAALPARLEPLGPIAGALAARTSRRGSGSGRRPPRGAVDVRVLAVGGSACAVAAWLHAVVPYAASEVQGRWIGREALQGTIDEWSRMSLADRQARGRMSEGRARVLPGGALLLDALLERLGLAGCRASTFGLRHGILLQRLLAL